jgi:predicted DNA-binding transcriptional regulator AlpA
VSDIDPDGRPVKNKMRLVTRLSVRTERIPMSRVTEWRRIRDDVDWPKPVDRYWYVEEEIDRYLETRIKARDSAS